MPQPNQSGFVYGSQFYRPPNPPRPLRRAALERIANEFKFNTIKIWVMWNWCAPEPKQFDFAEAEEILSACDELGLRVVVNTILETVPYWLDESIPDARYVNARGEALVQRGRSSDPSGGWPGLCFDHPRVREEGAVFLNAVAQTVCRHPSFFCYDCWNEPHVEPAWFNSMWPTPEHMLFCYCASTQARFREWLRAKYGTITALNEAWVRRYRHWDDVLAPQTHGTYADWLDWRRFMIDSITDQMNWRVQTLRAADPEHQVMSHGAQMPPLDPTSISATNGWDLAKPLDRWGCSAFPRWHRINPAMIAGKFETCRSNAGGKEWWLAELQGGHGMVTGLHRAPHVRPKDIRLWNWLAIAAGAKGIVYWTYMAEATGIEASGFGLVDRAGNTTERASEAVRSNALIQQQWHLLEPYQPVPQVAILYDQDNPILTFAMDGNENPATASARGYYQAVWKSDVWARFIQPNEISTLSPDIKVLMVPWGLIGKQETIQALWDYVEQGGVVIADTALGLFDEHGIYNPLVPPFNTGEKLGIREREAMWIPDTQLPATLWERMGPLGAPAGANIAPVESIYTSPIIRISSPLEVEIRPCVFLTPLAVCEPAQIIGTCEGLAVAVVARWGKGSVYYFGTNLGACIHDGQVGALEAVKAILAEHAPPVVSGQELRPRLIQGTQDALVVIINEAAEPISECVRLPQQYRQATDLYSGASLPMRDSIIEAAVEGQSVQVLHLM